MIDSLTALRGLAAAAVVLTHCLRLAESAGLAAAPSWLGWLDLGDFAVLVFFCLSGFTLVLAHREDRWDRAGLRRFAIRRVLRVYPAFLVSFAVSLACVAALQRWTGLPPGNWIADNDRMPDLGIALAYLTFTANLFGLEGYVNNVFWSLPIEFQFYLLFPLFLALLRRSPWFLAGAAVALGGAGRILHLPSLTADLAWIFAAGMAAAWLLAGRRLPGAAWVAAVAVAAACVIEALPMPVLRLLPGPLSLYLGSLAIVLVAATAGIDLRSQRARAGIGALLWQGDISYPIYLFHTPFVLLAYGLLRQWPLQGGAVWAAICLVVLPGTWIVAHLVHKAVEQPAIRFGRQVTAATPASG